MADEHKLVPHTNGSNGTVDLITVPARFPALDLSPREPHLYDYLLILRKHQWLILSFLLTVVTIVSIATFRMKSVYVATTRIDSGSTARTLWIAAAMRTPSASRSSSTRRAQLSALPSENDCCSGSSGRSSRPPRR